MINLSYRFGIISDPHIAIESTIWDHPSRFHLVEVSIPALKQAVEHLKSLDIDFLLLPGDLTQHGEPENHRWLHHYLQSLPFPCYVIPGNHDVPTLEATAKSIAWADFPNYYRHCGYQNGTSLDYSCEIAPGLQLVALNSNQFDDQGQPRGYLKGNQLTWLEQTLAQFQDRIVLMMIHHNVIEHLPGQAQHELGKRYMLENAGDLLQICRKYGVKLIFTGHLHVQDLAMKDDICEITTGSLVSYPHPYRLIEFQCNQQHITLNIESYRLNSVPGWENLPQTSREWMCDRSYPFMIRLLTTAPLNLPLAEAEILAPQLRYFWSDIAAGDAIIDFPTFPDAIREHFYQFSAINAEGELNLIDNRTKIEFFRKTVF